MANSTDVHLDRALKNVGLTPTGSNTYSDNAGRTVHTDDNFFKENGKGWKMHVPGQKIK